MVVAITGLGSTLNRVLDATGDSAAMDPDQLGLNPGGGLEPAEGPSPPTVLKQGAADATVRPVRATVFSPDGSPDNPESARNVIDGDPGTLWTTDRYVDRNPFPAFKQGVGVVLQLPQPTKIGTVTVDVAS
ncbi:hypothetical protein C6A85_86520, partial [Mycobacterium sp. ITM-2017-0098]